MTISWTSRGGGELQDEGGEGSPAQVGLGAEAEDEVVGSVLPLAGGEVGGGPLDLAVDAVAEEDVGAVLGEDEELVGVDLGEALAAGLAAEVAHGPGGGLGAVVPAAEGEDQDGRRRVGRWWMVRALMVPG